MPRIPAARALTLAVLLVAGAPAHAEAPSDIANTYANSARQAAPGFAGFSAARGKSFFQSTHGADWSCASCHTPANDSKTALVAAKPVPHLTIWPQDLGGNGMFVAAWTRIA